MTDGNRKPLIRKKYSFLDILKMILSKFQRTGNIKELYIPGFAKTIEFKSMVSHRNNGEVTGAVFQSSRAQILSAMKANNLRGFGGAGFAMADKLETVLNSGNPEPVLVINGVECDPGLYHDKWILENKQKELERVSGILHSAFGLSGIYLAKKTGTPSMKIEGVTCIDVPDTYPAGEENRLVSWLLGIEYPKGTYPADKGIWVQNVQSLLVLHAFLTGAPPRRYITMADLDRRHAVIVECDMDTSVGELSNEVFGRNDRLYLGGGIMQGISAEGSEILSSGINLIAVGDTADFSEKDCHHCGQCTGHCPAGLPVEDIVAEIAKGGEVPEERRNDCTRCGACSFLCPAGKDICSLIASV